MSAVKLTLAEQEARARAQFGASAFLDYDDAHLYPPAASGAMMHGALWEATLVTAPLTGDLWRINATWCDYVIMAFPAQWPAAPDAIKTCAVCKHTYRKSLEHVNCVGKAARVCPKCGAVENY